MPDIDFRGQTIEAEGDPNKSNVEILSLITGEYCGLQFVSYYSKHDFVNVNEYKANI